MAVTRISPLSGKEANHSGVQNRRASRRWIVLTNNRYDDEITVLTYGANNGFFPVPFVNNHPTWPGLICRSLIGRQDEIAPLKWIVTAEYSSEPITQATVASQFIPPLERPAQIRMRKSKYMKPQVKDILGQPYINSVGDPVDPPIELARGYPIYQITKNVAYAPPAFAVNGDCINSVPFFIENQFVDTYQARIEDWDRSELKDETDINGNLWQYYVLTWSIELNLVEVDNQGAPTGWLVVYLNQGLRCRRSPDRVHKFNIMDDSTPPQPITSPAQLDLNGFQITNPTSATATYITRHGYFEADFNEFPLF
jgi:hypothetical protein